MSILKRTVYVGYKDGLFSPSPFASVIAEGIGACLEPHIPFSGMADPAGATYDPTDEISRVDAIKILQKNEATALTHDGDVMLHQYDYGMPF